MEFFNDMKETWNCKQCWCFTAELAGCLYMIYFDLCGFHTVTITDQYKFDVFDV